MVLSGIVSAPVRVVGWSPPVVCVHGLTRNSRDFDYLAAMLQSDGRRVACPDIVGRGRSDWLADKRHYTFATYCADFTARCATVACGICW